MPSASEKSSKFIPGNNKVLIILPCLFPHQKATETLLKEGGWESGGTLLKYDCLWLHSFCVEALPKGQRVGISQVDVYKNAEKSRLVILNGL